MAETSKVNTPIVIGGVIAVLILVSLWFVIFWPGDGAKETTQNASQERVSGGQVKSPIVVVTEDDGYIRAKQVKPLQLDNGQYIYIVPYDNNRSLVSRRGSTRVEEGQVVGYTYVPEQ